MLLHIRRYVSLPMYYIIYDDIECRWSTLPFFHFYASVQCKHILVIEYKWRIMNIKETSIWPDIRMTFADDDGDLVSTYTILYTYAETKY